jgi:hypothetical protein
MAAEDYFGRSDPGKAVQCPLSAASLRSPAADEDSFLLRGVSSILGVNLGGR